MNDVVIVGGGPLVLPPHTRQSAAERKAVVLEQLDRVGGLSRTMTFQGSRFDVGPHRFFTKNHEVNALFVNTAAEDLLNVPRLTRIFYNDTYFNYPLTPLNALFGVGAYRPASQFCVAMS